MAPSFKTPSQELRSGRYVTVTISNVHSDPSSSHFVAWNCYNGLPQNCVVVVPFARNCSPSFKCKNRSFQNIQYNQVNKSLSFELRIDLGEDKARLANLRFSLWTKKEGVAFLTSESTVSVLIRCAKDDNKTLNVLMPTPSLSNNHRKRNLDEGEEEDYYEESIEAKRHKIEEPSSPLSDNLGSPVHFLDESSNDSSNDSTSSSNESFSPFDFESSSLDDSLPLDDSFWDSEEFSSLLSGFPQQF